MTVPVEFKLTKSADSRAAVVLQDGEGGKIIKLVFDSNGVAHAMVDPEMDYSAPWALIGVMGDTIKVTWSTATRGGVMIDSEINVENSQPYPSERRRAEDMGYLEPVGG